MHGSCAALLVERVHVGLGDRQLGDPRPAGVDGQLGAVLLRVETDRRRLDAHRQVLADDRHVGALGGEIGGHREDAGVVVTEPETDRQPRDVAVVELDVQGAAGRTDRHGPVQTARLDPQLVEHPQRGPGEIAEFGVVPLALELGDDDDREHDVVLVEPQNRPRVREQHRGVEHIGLAPLAVLGGEVGSGARHRLRVAGLTGLAGLTEAPAAGAGERPLRTTRGVGCPRCLAAVPGGRPGLRRARVEVGRG